MKYQLSDQIHAHRLLQSKDVKSLITSLVKQVTEMNSHIQEPKEPLSIKTITLQNQALIDYVKDLRGRPLFLPYIGSNAGNGVYVELEDGSVKMDLINGIGIFIMGHNHPRLIEAAVEASLLDPLIQGNLQLNRQWIGLAEKLVEIASRKSNLKHCWLTTSGSMANENALKMTRQKNTPARKIITMKEAFAGRTTMMAEISDNPAHKIGLPSYDEVLRVDFFNKNDPHSMEHSLSQLRKHIGENKGDIAAFVFEPVLGEGGYKVAPRDFFIPLLEECKKEGIAIWVDEIQTFCRTGQFFAYQTLDLGSYVDVVTVAKALQLGATLYTSEYNPGPGLIAGTFAGSTVQLHVGLKILEILDKENYMGPSGKIQSIHQEFVSMLEDLSQSTCKGLISDVEGLGLMVAFTPFNGEKQQQNQVVKTLFKNGLIVFGCGHSPYRIRFLIPSVMKSKDIAMAKQIIEKSLLEIHST